MGWARQYGRLGLNALSGIGCVRTQSAVGLSFIISSVLMPCRALGAFGLTTDKEDTMNAYVS